MQWSGETENQWKTRTLEWHRAFAVLPTQMDNGKWVWLEPYWIRRMPVPNGWRWDRQEWAHGIMPLPDPPMTRPPPPSRH